jgi:hypothetical protein
MKHPTKQNLLQHRKGLRRTIDSESEEQEPAAEDLAGVSGEAVTAEEQDRLDFVASDSKKLLIVSNRKPPRALQVDQPEWLLMVSSLQVDNCSDNYCEQLFQRLNTHKLVHCSFPGLAETLSTGAVESLITLLDAGCLSMVTHVRLPL